MLLTKINLLFLFQPLGFFCGISWYINLNLSCAIFCISHAPLAVILQNESPFSGGVQMKFK